MVQTENYEFGEVLTDSYVIKAVYENLNGQKINLNSDISEDITYINNGSSAYEIKSLKIGEEINLIQTTSDPDGNPINQKYNYKWQTSIDNSNWDEVGVNSSYIVKRTIWITAFIY